MSIYSFGLEFLNLKVRSTLERLASRSLYCAILRNVCEFRQIQFLTSFSYEHSLLVLLEAKSWEIDLDWEAVINWLLAWGVLWRYDDVRGIYVLSARD